MQICLIIKNLVNLYSNYRLRTVFYELLEIINNSRIGRNYLKEQYFSNDFIIMMAVVLNT